MQLEIGVATDTQLRRERIVRRYLDLPKYLDLLRSSTLYFRRADGFTDRFEGALTPAIRRAIDEAHKNGQAEQNADNYYLRARKGNYVSCWSMGANDNMALWQLYGGVSASVAITSTIGALVGAAAQWEGTTLIHKVKYIDHFKNPDMVIGRYTDLLRFKHEAYRYEDEARLIIPRQYDGWESNPVDLRLPIHNLNALIRSVVVAPEAGDWFFDLVADITQKYDIRVPVRRSKLTRLPK